MKQKRIKENIIQIEVQAIRSRAAYFGGVWNRLVKKLQKRVRAVSENRSVTEDVLSTMI